MAIRGGSALPVGLVYLLLQEAIQRGLTTQSVLLEAIVSKDWTTQFNRYSVSNLLSGKSLSRSSDFLGKHSVASLRVKTKFLALLTKLQSEWTCASCAHTLSTLPLVLTVPRLLSLDLTSPTSCIRSCTIEHAAVTSASLCSVSRVAATVHSETRAAGQSSSESRKPSGRVYSQLWQSWLFLKGQ